MSFYGAMVDEELFGKVGIIEVVEALK